MTKLIMVVVVGLLLGSCSVTETEMPVIINVDYSFKADDLVDYLTSINNRSNSISKTLSFEKQSDPIYFSKPFVIKSDNVTIGVCDNGEIIFDGSASIDISEFKAVNNPSEREWLAKKAKDKILVAKINDNKIAEALGSAIVQTLLINDKNYLPSVFPNAGYAKFAGEVLEAEISPPAIPEGKLAYGVRAGTKPYRMPGKPNGWKGSLEEPMGAQVGFVPAAEKQMAGSWLQWQQELARNNRRSMLSGYIEAHWCYSSQHIFAASASNHCIHLTKVLGYGWDWRKNSKIFKVYGLLCELDAPGEWYYDTNTRQLFIYPPENQKLTSVRIPVANGGFIINNANNVKISGITLRNIRGGNAFDVRGTNNLIAACKVINSTACGVSLSGFNNAVKGCDFIDLNRHVILGGGHRNPNEIVPGSNLVENCHIYQDEFSHARVGVSVRGVANIFRHNLVHNSFGQAMTVNGNDHLIEYNEFFNIGFDEGDGGAVYSGADLAGYGITYQYNFFHHLMHVPGKVHRSGIHLDDLQAGSTCIGNIFYKSAAKCIFMNNGAGHVIKDNICLESGMGIYNVACGAKKKYVEQLKIEKSNDPNLKKSKENYVGRAELIVGPDGWSKSPWKDKYPRFNKVMSDEGENGRMWPIHCYVNNNFYYGNRWHNKTVWSRVAPEAMKKVVITNDVLATKEIFVDYDNMNFAFNRQNEKLADNRFEQMGLKTNQYRLTMPSKSVYRNKIKDFFKGIGSMPGTTNQINTANLIKTK